MWDGTLGEGGKKRHSSRAGWCAVFVPEQAQRKGACGWPPLQGPRDAHYPGEHRRAAVGGCGCVPAGPWFGTGLAGHGLDLSRFRGRWCLHMCGAAFTDPAMRQLSKRSCILRLRQGIADRGQGAGGQRPDVAATRGQAWFVGATGLEGSEYRFETAHVLVLNNQHVRGSLPSARQGCGEDPSSRDWLRAWAGGKRGSERFVAE